MNSIVPNLSETKYARRLYQYLEKYKEGERCKANFVFKKDVKSLGKDGASNLTEGNEFAFDDP